MKQYLRRKAENVLRWRAHHSTPRLMQGKEGAGPDFLCIGMQRAGTQWLYDQLRYHPDFWMPPIKELRYFTLPPSEREHLRRVRGNWDKVRNWNSRNLSYLSAVNWISWRKVDVEEYARIFNVKDGKISGDISPDYCAMEDRFIDSIIARFPNIRIVCIVRDPVDRFWSALLMGWRQGRYPALGAGDDLSLVRAALNDPGDQALSYPSQIVERWRRHVPSNQFGIFFYDDLTADAVPLRKRLIEFLGGDSSKPTAHLPPSFNRKGSHRKQVMSAEVRDIVVNHFAVELNASARLLGGPAAAWPAKYGL